MNILKAMFLGLAMTSVSVISVAKETLPTITVYKSATCGCCSGWIEHIEESGFKVKFRNVEDLEKYRKQADVPYGLGACHTAFVDGYAVEGHVPASDIKRMLTEKPAIRGIALPGMPMGSPGMDYGDKKVAYQTISYTKDGKTAVYASH